MKGCGSAAMKTAGWIEIFLLDWKTIHSTSSILCELLGLHDLQILPPREGEVLLAWIAVDLFAVSFLLHVESECLKKPESTLY